MKKIIYVLIAGLFTIAAGSALSVSAQEGQEAPACTNSICNTPQAAGGCRVKLRFRCERTAVRCFSIPCEFRTPPGQAAGFNAVARMASVNSGAFTSEDGIKMKNRMSVPLTAVFTSSEGQYVYLVTKTGTVMRRVTTGAMGDTEIEITKGLKPGDKVIINPLSIDQRGEKNQ